MVIRFQCLQYGPKRGIARLYPYTWSFDSLSFTALINISRAASWQNQQCGCAPSEDSDQPGHPPSLIRVFTVRLMGSLGPKLSLCGQRRLWSDWADAQADQSLCWAYNHFVGFVMRQFIILWHYLWISGKFTRLETNAKLKSCSDHLELRPSPRYWQLCHKGTRQPT